MSRRELDRLRRILLNPPPGSKVAAAKEFGTDLTLTLHQLQLSPSERLRAIASAQGFISQLRDAALRLR